MSQRMAIFIPSFERGGVERNVINVSQGLIDAGKMVDIVMARSTGPLVEQIPEAARVIYVGRRGLLPRITRLVTAVNPRTGVSLAAARGLVSYLRRERPDVLISFQSSALAILASSLAGYPVKVVAREAATPTEALAGSRSLLARAVPRLKRWTYPRAHAIIANSAGAASDLARMLRVSSERVTVIYNPSFTDSVLERSREPVVHPWLQPDQPPVVLAVGRLTPQKDFETLLRAFALVRQSVPARLLVLGDGNERRKLERLAQQLGIAQDTDLHGFVDNPYRYMTRADVFVLSSRWEGLPNALIEAVGLGMPVVSTDCPSGPREILMDGAAGELVPVGDSGTLASAIRRTLGDRQLAAAYVREGQKGISRFRPEAGIERWLQVLDEI